jgi:predicted metalloprotease with PDZ domain
VTGGGGLVQGLALTGDERHLLVASGSSLQVWETARLTKVSVLQHHTQNINALAVHGGGRWIATAGLDCQVKFWGYRSGGMTHVRPKGFFGIRVQDSPDGDGVLVTDVIANTAAESAGIRSGDLIRAVGGERVTNSNESIAMISSFFADDEVEFTILREGAERKIRAKLGKRPENLEK